MCIRDRIGAILTGGPFHFLLSGIVSRHALSLGKAKENVMQKTYHGRCHCGAVQFAAELDLAAGTSRCNCSYCRKLRSWSVRSTPEHFRLESGAQDLASYVFAKGAGLDHAFCRHCGVTLFVRGDIPEMGGAFVSIMVAVLEDCLLYTSRCV